MIIISAFVCFQCFKKKTFANLILDAHESIFRMFLNFSSSSHQNVGYLRTCRARWNKHASLGWKFILFCFFLLRNPAFLRLYHSEEDKNIYTSTLCRWRCVPITHSHICRRERRGKPKIVICFVAFWLCSESGN
jgi:hypothetical protein